jgi:hypothetical protein
MDKDYTILSESAYFARAGAAFTVPANGVVSSTSKPGPTDAVWLDLGHVETKTKRTVELDKVRRGTPGKRRLKKVIETSSETVEVLSLQELQDLVYELIFGTLPLANGGQYNPEEGSEVEGWLKLQEYDQHDQLVNTRDLYVYLEPPSEMDRADKKVVCEVNAYLLYSPLNTGNLRVRASS